MAAFQFTARRSLLPTHVDGEIVNLECDLVDTTPSRRVRKAVIRAVSGRTETLFHRADTDRQLLFAPVRGHLLDQLLEFLDSTASGETFLVWLYGTEGEPMTLRRSDSGYTLTPFMRIGSPETDWFQPAISVVTAL